MHFTIGFCLGQNEEAVNVFAMMTKGQKQAIWNKAHHARSEKEMQQIIDSIAAKRQEAGQGHCAPVIFIMAMSRLVKNYN